MIDRILKVALLGSAVGLAAHLPIATTALSSTPRFIHALGYGPTAGAEGTAEAPPTALSPDEQKFVRSAHVSGLYAIGAGQLAFQSSSIREVKMLAAHTLTQHAGVEEKLAELAKIKGMAALPEELDANSRESLEVLQQISGDEDFELRYCRMVVASYFREIRAFERQADIASDPDLRKLAAEVASDLKQHLAMALVIQRALASALDGSGAAMAASQPLSSRMDGKSTQTTSA
jgi:predicted outer membrane protein